MYYAAGFDSVHWGRETVKAIFLREILNKIILERSASLLAVPLLELDTPSPMILELSSVEVV
jgi:hypothetical protein